MKDSDTGLDTFILRELVDTNSRKSDLPHRKSEAEKKKETLSKNYTVCSCDQPSTKIIQNVSFQHGKVVKTLSTTVARLKYGHIPFTYENNREQVFLNFVIHYKGEHQLSSSKYVGRRTASWTMRTDISNTLPPNNLF